MVGIQKLNEILSSHELGEINSIRLDLGHGGSPRDADSWKLNKESAGGGSLLDPGIHLIDLVLFLFGSNTDSVEIDGVNYWSGFWKTGIEESTMVLGKVEGVPFYLVSSIVAWRTRFSVEIIGSDGYVIVNGRGRSDGPQTLTVGRRWGWQNAKSQIDSEKSEVIMMQDSSITKETEAWLDGNSQVCFGEEGLESMKLYQKILSKKSPNDLR
jgi:predicted dehydrogenase